VNHGWLCDKGRFTLDAVDGNEESVDVLKTATRIREPLVREKGKLVPTNWGTALARASEILLSAASSADGVGAIGGASLTNEGAFAWERYVRGVLGSNNLDAQFGDGLDGALMRALPAATIDQVSRASTIVTLCGDLRDELPVLYLRLRENLTKRKAALVEFRQAPSHLTPLATKSIPVLPGEVHQVVADFVNATKSDEHYAARTLVGETGAGVVFVVGRMNVGESPRYLETAIRQLAERFPEATFLSALRRSNVHGALDMGLDPRLVPGRRLAEVTGRSSLEQFEAMRNGEQKAVLLLGGCVLGNVVDVDGAKLALSKASVVAVTGHGGATLEYADVVLPALVQHERVGTFTNLEGRLSALQAKVSPAGSAWSDVAIASELAEESGQNLGLSSVEHAAQTIEATTGYPTWRVLSAPSNDGLLASDAGSPLPSAPLDPTAIPGVQSVSTVGIGAGVGATAVESVSAGAVFAPLSLSALGELSVPKKPARSVKALRVVATRALYDDGIAVTASPALQGVREEAVAHVSAATAKKFGIADHGRVTLRSSVSSQAVATAIADGVTDGTVWIRYGERSADGRDAIRPLLVGDDVITVEVEA
jgi:NADH-quinone oxidoreductase subunit G